MNQDVAESTFISDSDIAIIAISCRFPGANNTHQFWQNLRDGVESVSWFEDDEVLAEGINARILENPNYVKAGAILEDIDKFDAFFFDINSREAEIIDPQHRIFLECASEAIEKAGYNPHNDNSNAIALYAGVGMNSYFLNNVIPYLKSSESASGYQAFIGNDKDFVPTRVSYKLNLKGASLNVNTACSSSLVAVHLACQSLLSGECDMAMAGGVSINPSQKNGYMYQEGMIMSPDGHCRSFDAKAKGTVGGSGAGVVVLKRLADAFAHSYANNSDRFVTSINWDAWQQVGMAVNTEVSKSLKAEQKQNLQQGILPSEGVAVFDRIVNSILPQILVSTRDFANRISPREDFITPDAGTIDDSRAESYHSRPDLSSIYVAPSSEIEKTPLQIQK